MRHRADNRAGTRREVQNYAGDGIDLPQLSVICSRWEGDGVSVKITGESQRLRIYLGEADRFHGHPLYQEIVKEARKNGLAGATAFRGNFGFGAHSRIKQASLLDLSADLPIVVEIVDSSAYIEKFLPVIDRMLTEGLVTIEPVDVVKYAHRHHPHT